MKFIKQKIKGVYLINHEGFKDKRGLFSRVYCKKFYKKFKFIPVQTNISYNKKKKYPKGVPLPDLQILREETCVLY